MYGDYLIHYVTKFEAKIQEYEWLATKGVAVLVVKIWYKNPAYASLKPHIYLSQHD